MSTSAPTGTLRDAALAAVIYADLFDFPLDRAEIHRDLIGVAAPRAATDAAIERLIASGALEPAGEFAVLPGRGALAARRRERRAHAALLWRQARRFGGLLARFPFVRMVGVSGSLAAENPDPRADIDFLIVTTPGRLWLVRGLAVLLVRAARAGGVQLCPNYLLTTRALGLVERDLYTAHELLQLVPLAGAATYRQLLDENAWTAAWLPNRFARAMGTGPLPTGAVRLVRLGEAALGGALGDRIERWEARRKRRRLGANGQALHFTDDVCAGHYGRHRQRLLEEFVARCARAQVAVPAIAAASRESWFAPEEPWTSPLPAAVGVAWDASAGTAATTEQAT